MTLSVIAAQLKVPAVFAETQGEHFVSNYAALLHQLEYWPHLVVGIVSLRQTQYPICLLRIEQMSLCGHAAESDVECIIPQVRSLSVMDLVPDHKSVVGAPLSVGLSEIAEVLLSAAACVHLAIVDVLCRTRVQGKIGVQVLPARLAMICAREGYDAGACVHDERLGFSLGAHLEDYVEILQVSAIAIEGT